MINLRIPTEGEIQKAHELHYKNIMYKPKRNKDWEAILITLTACSIVYGEATGYLGENNEQEEKVI